MADLTVLLLSSDRLSRSNVRIPIYHRPYLTIAKRLDTLMEPGFFCRGLDEEW
jgi:hypothetical protein